jgi:hypothetical protein
VHDVVVAHSNAVHYKFCKGTEQHHEISARILNTRHDGGYQCSASIYPEDGDSISVATCLPDHYMSLNDNIAKPCVPIHLLTQTQACILAGTERRNRHGQLLQQLPQLYRHCYTSPCYWYVTYFQYVYRTMQKCIIQIIRNGEYLRPPLWSSGQSSWLQIGGPGSIPGTTRKKK